MTSDQTPAPTRNVVGLIFDSALLLLGVYLTAAHGGRLVRRVGQAGLAASVNRHLLTLFLFSLGVGLVVLAVPALRRNFQRVPRDEAGRPLPAPEGSEPSGDRER